MACVIHKTTTTIKHHQAKHQAASQKKAPNGSNLDRCMQWM
jgi:hypothetical protein